MKYVRLQSAIEFLTTYAFAILIITVVISIIITLAYIPRNSIPQSCDFYGGLTCTDVAYFNLSHAGGSSLVISAIDAEPGIMNVSSFNAVVDYRKSFKGSCYPNPVSQGDIIYCTANFTEGTSTGITYSGTFNISAQYCTPGPEEIATANCSALAPASLFSGTFFVSSSPSGIAAELPLAYVPITLTNSQQIASGAPLQIYITVNSVNYDQYITGNWMNVEFTEYRPAINGGVPINAWVEANPSNTATDTNVWIKIPGGMPAESNTVVYMNFMPKSVMSPSGPTGEAPQSSAVNGKYNDIAAVMNKGLLYQIYDNHAESGVGCNMAGGATVIEAASMAQGNVIAGCSGSDFTALSAPATTQFTGTAGHVCYASSGVVVSTDANYIVANYWNTVPYASSNCYTNPGGPKSIPTRFLANQTGDPYIIKMIGWAVAYPSVLFNGVFNDGCVFGFSYGSNVGGGTGSDWLGTYTNACEPAGFSNGEPAGLYSGNLPGSSGISSYRIEVDYYQSTGAAYFSLFTESNSIDFYSATPPPDGISPSYTFGGVVVHS